MISSTTAASFRGFMFLQEAYKIDSFLDIYSIVHTMAATRPTQEIVYHVKKQIDAGDLEGIQRMYLDILNTDFETGHEPDIGYMFSNLYKHACLKGQRDIAEWLTRALYHNMDPIQQIALRQIFPYGRWLLARASRKRS